jgi:hypothetical protein
MAKTSAKPATQVAVQEVEDNSLVLVQDEMPDFLQEKQGEQARGSENVTTDDIVIPRLEIIQALSPAVKDGDPGFLPDARPGMLMNSVTKQLYGKEVHVVPVYYMKQWLVWGARKDKKTGKPLEGGFFGAFSSSQEAQDRADQEANENIDVIDTPQHLCLLLNKETGGVEEAMVSMPRTKSKISRQWNSMIKLAGGDRFSRVYKVSATLEKKPQGDYYNFAVSQIGFPSKDLYNQAEKLYTAVQAGQRAVVVDADFGGEAAVEGTVETEEF